MRILAALAFLVLLATFAPPAPHRDVPPPARTLIGFEPVPLDPGAPDRSSAGRLRYLSGWELDSNDHRFGGISAMHVAGDEVVAVTDAGSLIRFGLPGSPSRARIEPLSDGPGSGDVKGDRDAEAMAVYGGHAWIGYERSNAVWRYRKAGWQPDAAARPAGMRRWRANRGPEAMVRLPGGRFLVFSEGAGDGDSPVLLFAGDPAADGTAATLLRYRPPAGYRITDAALLPGGGLLLLNRRVSLFGGVSARLSVVRLPKLGAGTLIVGKEVAELSRPLTVDNMEALSVTRDGGRTIVWIASDDNFNPLQRTLLLKFALE